jgi:uncharacterized membrane-anchored protein
MEDQSKKPWQSKTNIVALVVALAAFVPQMQAFIGTNPELFAQVMSGVFIALRMITKDKVSIK